MMDGLAEYCGVLAAVLSAIILTAAVAMAITVVGWSVFVIVTSVTP